jgi:hypothetical protein
MKSFTYIIKTALESGTIHNVDFKDAKYYASRAYEQDSNNIRGRFFHGGLYQNRTDVEKEIDYAISYSVTQFPSKKLIKLLSTAERTDYVSAVQDLVDQWKPVSDDLKALKPLVVKGRKPSDTPRLTPQRTLENTGTCAVCGKNVKLDSAGTIVSHGYTVRYGYHEGNCFGVGYQPVEVSPAGLHAYLEALVAVRKNADDTLMNLELLPIDNRNKIRMQTEQTIRFVVQDIDYYTTKIYYWEAQPLPDAS